MPGGRAPGAGREIRGVFGFHPRGGVRRKHDRQRRVAHRVLLQAGAPGFEPGIADPKSAAFPLVHAPLDTTKRIGRRPLFPGLLAPLDQFGHASSAFAAELRVSLTAELRFARLATLAAELGVPARSELRLTRFAALSPELGVPLRTELSLAGLPTAPTDLAIEGRAVLARGRSPSALTSLADRELPRSEER